MISPEKREEERNHEKKNKENSASGVVGETRRP